jgi:hypothetical protein
MLRHAQWLTPSFVVVFVCVVCFAGVLLSSDGDPLAFVLLGTRFSQGDPQGSEGYDGQFAYQIAIDPAGAVPYIDVPAYRYQRVLYPALARILGLGQPELIPWTLILVNIAAIGLGTWATEQLLLNERVSRWYALSYGLYGGQLLALRADLNEPLAQAFVQLAMLAWVKDRRVWTVIAFSLAVLAKETALIFLAAYMLFTLKERQWRWNVGLGLGLVPFMVYQLILKVWLGSFGVGSGGAGATPFSLIPLGGWLAIAEVSFRAFLLISIVVVPMSILTSIAGVVLSGRSLRHGEAHPYVFSLLLNSLIILFLPSSTFREPVAMLRLTQGVMVSLLLYGGLVRSRRILNYSIFWIATNVLLIGGVAGPG